MLPTETIDLPVFESGSASKNRNQPLVTIGIPTFNRMDLLIRAINSAREQSYTNLEIIISDNFSSDGTEELCRTQERGDERIVYLRQSENVGAAGNFHRVLDVARGEFFMWLGDDDWINSDYVEKCLAELQNDVELVLVSGKPQYYRNGVFAYDGRLFDCCQIEPRQRLQSYYAKVTDNGIFYGLFRTKVVKNLRLTHALGGDWHFIAEILISGGCKMIATTSVHRELGGASESYKKLIASYDLPQIARLIPSIFLALSGVSFMANSSNFLSLPYAKRLQYRLAVTIVLRPIVNIPYRFITKLKRIWM
jgi:glycosyltransferase involved in cell wall biosynthesis